MSLNARSARAQPVLVQHDEAVFVLVVALSLVHILYDAFVLGGSRQPGRGLVMSALSLVFVALYHRLRAHERARCALILGLLGAVMVLATHLPQAIDRGVDLGILLAGIAFAGSLLLVVMGWALTTANRARTP
jgi:hypothetical protein